MILAVALLFCRAFLDNFLDNYLDHSCCCIVLLFLFSLDSRLFLGRVGFGIFGTISVPFFIGVKRQFLETMETVHYHPNRYSTILCPYW